MRKFNRIIDCPECGARLSSDKKPYLAEDGTSFRTRLCKGCGVVVYSRQLAEELTGVECAAVSNGGEGGGYAPELAAKPAAAGYNAASHGNFFH